MKTSLNKISKRTGCAIALTSSLLSSLLVLPTSSVKAETSIAQTTAIQTTAIQTTVAQTTASPNEPIQFSPPPLPDRGRPGGRSSGGASRGSCDTPNQLPLTALVPVTPSATANSLSETDLATATTESVFSLTSQANPTFWFYVPYTLSETPIEFVLQDEQNNTLYQTRFTGNSESGIVSIALPEEATQLETNTLYHWYFMAFCDDNNPAFVEGWTERTSLEPALSAELEQYRSDPRAQAALYAQNGIWQEAITLLGQQYYAERENANTLEDWNNLLESAALGDFGQQPLTDCCGL
ncbi:MAG: DUF928 domain-containing protein [Phormidesmis sp.]